MSRAACPIQRISNERPFHATNMWPSFCIDSKYCSNSCAASGAIMGSGTPDADFDIHRRSSPPTACVAATAMSNGPKLSRSCPGPRSMMFAVSMSNVMIPICRAEGSTSRCCPPLLGDQCCTNQLRRRRPASPTTPRSARAPGAGTATKSTSIIQRPGCDNGVEPQLA